MIDPDDDAEQLTCFSRVGLHGMSSATYYAWKAKFGGLTISDAKRLRSLEEENARLKRLLADAILDNAGFKDLLSKNCGDARREAASGRVSSGDFGDERAADLCFRRADRTRMRYRSCRADDGGDLRSRPRELAEQRQRFGYRRLRILLRREGITINYTKIRLFREE